VAGYFLEQLGHCESPRSPVKYAPQPEHRTCTFSTMVYLRVRGTSGPQRLLRSSLDQRRIVATIPAR
jgi:hypothetical protein